MFYFLSELSSHESIGIAFDMEFFHRFVFDVKWFVFEKSVRCVKKMSYHNLPQPQD